MTPARVLIYRLGSLGDTVAALPAFHLIERTFPSSERLVLTNVPVSSKAAPLEIILRDGGFIHGAIPYPVGLRDPGELRRLAQRLRDLRCDTLVYLAASRGLAQAWRDVAFFRAAGFRHILGAPLTPDRQRNRVDDEGMLERESARLIRNLRGLGHVDLHDRAWWDLRLTDAERGAADTAVAPLDRQPFLAVNTGGKAVEKDWGELRWAALLEALASSMPGAGLLFVGAAEDSERAATLAAHWDAGPTLDLCGALTPRQSAAALARAALFVGHDSGPLHLADAVGAPSIGLFGAYNRPQMWHPSGSRTHVIHRMSGLDRITVEEVAAAARRLVPDPRYTSS